MHLDRLNYWRMLRGYSIKELAMLCDLDPSTIWQIEKHSRPAYGSTARKLGEVLKVDVSELCTEPIVAVLNQAELTIPEEIYKKPIIEIKSAWPIRTRTKKKQPATGDCWVLDFDGDAFGPFSKEDAERLKEKLGGQHRARIYEAATKAAANDKHTEFLREVARGHDNW